jgi:hypothetical protein
MRVAYKHAHQLLETAYEATLISCSSGEVKLENLLGFTVRRSRFTARRCGSRGTGWFLAPRTNGTDRTYGTYMIWRGGWPKGEPPTAKPLTPRHWRGLADAGESIGSRSREFVLQLDLQPFADAGQHEP